MKIKTHSHIQSTPISHPNEPRFTLNALFPLSSNIEVRRYPKRLILWGLDEGETASVHIVRTQSLGNPDWATTDDCCPCIIEPDAVANVAHMPYKKGKQAVILDTENPTAHLDDAGIYYVEYHGLGEVVLEHYDDPVIPKHRLSDYDL